MTVAERLEELRAAIRAENISWGELAELQGLADEIDPFDVELLEWAGVTEEEANRRQEEVTSRGYVDEAYVGDPRAEQESTYRGMV